SVLFFNPPSPTELYPLSLHDALPISGAQRVERQQADARRAVDHAPVVRLPHRVQRLKQPILATGSAGEDLLERRQLDVRRREVRSEEHTSELQSRFDLVCRLLLEKKK